MDNNNLREQGVNELPVSNVTVCCEFALMREPVLSNYTRIYHSLIEFEGSETIVKARLRNAYTIHKSWGVYNANDNIGRHFSNWSIARPQDFKEFCGIILNTGDNGSSINRDDMSKPRMNAKVRSVD